MGETADTSVNCIFVACKALHFILNRHSIHHKHVLQRWIMLLFSMPLAQRILWMGMGHAQDALSLSRSCWDGT